MKNKLFIIVVCLIFVGIGFFYFSNFKKKSECNKLIDFTPVTEISSGLGTSKIDEYYSISGSTLFLGHQKFKTREEAVSFCMSK